MSKHANISSEYFWNMKVKTQNWCYSNFSFVGCLGKDHFFVADDLRMQFVVAWYKTFVINHFVYGLVWYIIYISSKCQQPVAQFQFKMNAFVRKTITQKPQVVPTQQGRDTEDHIATYSCLPYAKRMKKCRIRIRVQGWNPVISSAKMSLYRRNGPTIMCRLI